MVSLLDRLASARGRREALRDWLNAAARDWTSGPLADAIMRNAADFEARDASISAADLDIGDVATLIGEQEDANDALGALARKAAGGRAGGAKGGRRGGSATPRPPKTNTGKSTWTISEWMIWSTRRYGNRLSETFK